LKGDTGKRKKKEKGNPLTCGPVPVKSKRLLPSSNIYNQNYSFSKKKKTFLKSNLPKIETFK